MKSTNESLSKILLPRNLQGKLTKRPVKLWLGEVASAIKAGWNPGFASLDSRIKDETEQQ